jgi:hypothetical protein
MRSVADYRRFARECRRLAAALTEPDDKRALELMATGWDKTAEKRAAIQRDETHQERLVEAEGCC